jgi:hypothetical protein
MSHSFQVPDDLYTEIATYAARHGQSPDLLLMDLVKEGVEQLKQTDSMAALRKIPYDPAHDPLAPFIGAFDSGNKAAFVQSVLQQAADEGYRPV